MTEQLRLILFGAQLNTRAVMKLSSMLLLSLQVP